MMKRAYRVKICTALFLLCTAVKMLSPSAAALLRQTVLPVLDRNDDYRAALYRVESALFPKDYSDAQPYVPDPPLTHLRDTLDATRSDHMADLPKVSRPAPTPTPEPVPEPTENPALTFGYAAREAFLRAQSEVSDQAPPENVSYDVLALPFSETAPVAGESSSGFGYRIHPIQNTLRFHYGTDFAADEGTPVLAFADGTVLAAGEDEGYGSYVKLDHGDGFVTLYGHCSALLVSAGETVQKGQTIALVGSTGQSTGPHLHFELMHNGIYLNPEFYLFA